MKHPRVAQSRQSRLIIVALGRAGERRSARRNLVLPPDGQAFWQKRGYLFGEEFRDHVENDIMRRKPHVSARPMGAFPIAVSTSAASRLDPGERS